jgi:16S rRNA (cytosine1402-N4)-methyltransferase
VFDDVPVTFNSKEYTDKELEKLPKDEDGEIIFPDPTPYPKNLPYVYNGLTTVHDALRRSVNTISVRILDRLGIEKVDGVLLDLGVSSHQLDAAERGFSYHNEAPLDMRMSQEGTSAYDIVNTFTGAQLAKILYDYGEEKFTPRIVNAIVDARAVKPIETTTELAEIVKNAYPAAARRGSNGHPARQTFQAIRIATNGELDRLAEALDRVFDRLAPGGRFAIITFHSLEDRMVKRAFAEYTKGCTCPPEFPVCICGKTPRGKLTTRKPIEATKEELEYNHRSRSAKLRVIEKL